jgi:hypothetical protein
MGNVIPSVLDGSLAANPGLSLDQPWGQLGPGLEAPEIREALAQLSRDQEVRSLLVFGSRWHVLGHVHREGVLLDPRAGHAS